LEKWRFFFSQKNHNIFGKYLVYTKLDFIGMNCSQLERTRLTTVFAPMQLHINTKRVFAT